MIHDPKSRNQLMRYSLNLLGVYQTDHTRFKITDETLHTDWEIGTEGVMPADNVVIENEIYGNLFFNYKIIEDFSVRYEDRSNNQNAIRSITAEIKHKPSKCNFWHYEILWKNDLGIFIENFSKGPQKSAVSAIRSYLIEIASEIPSEQSYVIEESLYES